ncbi:hypothetical protein SNEBB_000828 [Seison nebaliae]|nr:hypothetical protein SNEBB_000828 [Seison nebaliae]
MFNILNLSLILNIILLSSIEWKSLSILLQYLSINNGNTDISIVKVNHSFIKHYFDKNYIYFSNSATSLLHDCSLKTNKIEISKFSRLCENRPVLTNKFVPHLFNVLEKMWEKYAPSKNHQFDYGFISPNFPHSIYYELFYNNQQNNRFVKVKIERNIDHSHNFISSQSFENENYKINVVYHIPYESIDYWDIRYLSLENSLVSKLRKNLMQWNQFSEEILKSFNFIFLHEHSGENTDFDETIIHDIYQYIFNDIELEKDFQLLFLQHSNNILNNVKELLKEIDYFSQKSFGKSVIFYTKTLNFRLRIPFIRKLKKLLSSSFSQKEPSIIYPISFQLYSPDLKHIWQLLHSTGTIIKHEFLHRMLYIQKSKESTAIKSVPNHDSIFINSNSNKKEELVVSSDSGNWAEWKFDVMIFQVNSNDLEPIQQSLLVNENVMIDETAKLFYELKDCNCVDLQRLVIPGFFQIYELENCENIMEENRSDYNKRLFIQCLIEQTLSIGSHWMLGTVTFRSILESALTEINEKSL